MTVKSIKALLILGYVLRASYANVPLCLNITDDITSYVFVDPSTYLGIFNLKIDSLSDEQPRIISRDRLLRIL
jgi:hypothetical protein